MRIIHNAGKVARRAHSVRAWAAALIFGFCGVLGDSWQYFDGLLPMPPLAFAILGVALGAVGLVGRFLDQDL
jgi:hypothetical protein